jgi:hypothetical protein
MVEKGVERQTAVRAEVNFGGSISTYLVSDITIDLTHTHTALRNKGMKSILQSFSQDTYISQFCATGICHFVMTDGEWKFECICLHMYSQGIRRTQCYVKQGTSAHESKPLHKQTRHQTTLSKMAINRRRILQEQNRHDNVRPHRRNGKWFGLTLVSIVCVLHLAHRHDDFRTIKFRKWYRRDLMTSNLLISCKNLYV